MKLRGAIIAITIIINSIIFKTQIATACDCSPISHQTMLEKSDITFEGKVISLLKSDPSVDRRGIAAIFTVLRAWKGIEAGQSISIQTSDSGASCGVPFEMGKTYLVHAYRSVTDTDNIAYTSMCMATRPILEFSIDAEKILGPAPKLQTTPLSSAKALPPAITVPSKNTASSCAASPSPADFSFQGHALWIFGALARLSAYSPRRRPARKASGAQSH